MASVFHGILVAFLTFLAALTAGFLFLFATGPNFFVFGPKVCFRLEGLYTFYRNRRLLVCCIYLR